MRLIFVGCYCESSQKDYLFNITGGRISFSATAFQEGVLDGLAKNNCTPHYIVNLPAIGSYPKRCRSLYIRGGSFSFNKSKGYNCGFVNLTYLKRYFCEVSYFNHIQEVINKIDTDENIIILSYSLQYPILSSITRIKKTFKNRTIKHISIVPDMPDFIDGPRNARLLYKLCDSIDGFVLLTGQMAEKLGVGPRPYVIMEGIYQSPATNNTIVRKCSNKVILYTGTLDSRYGIINLLTAFSRIPDSSLELWVCGSGTDDEVSVMNKYAQQDKRICYLGILKREDVLLLQRKASFLVNPRDCHGVFTKYSFPSKTMEYLASGTPTIMYPLPGIPAEYFDNVILFDNNDPDTIKNTIERVISSDYKKYNELGARAQRFILENKVSDKQTMRIKDLIEKI